MSTARFLLVLPILLAGAGPAAGQSATAMLEWEIGGIEGPDETLWAGPVDGCLLQDEIYVVDSRAPVVRRFNLDGDFLGELGGAGSGPGEFVRPTHVQAFGDSVGVWDWGQRRWSLFDPAGQHLATRSAQPFPTIRYAAITEHFGKVGAHQLGLTAHAFDDSEAFPQAFIGWSTAEAVDTIATFPHVGLMYRTYSDGQWNPTGRSLGPSGDVGLAGSTIVVLDGLRPALLIYERDEGGVELVSEVALPGEPQSIDRALREEIRERLLADRSDAWASYEMRFPDALPAWSRVLVVDANEVWLRQGGEPELLGGAEVWVRWTSAGGVGGELALAPGERLLDVSRTHALAVWRGDFDEQYLRLYRLGETR